MTVIWHNPRCSKSRATMALLTERGITPEIRDYRNDPPDLAELTEVLALLNARPRDIARVKDAAFRALDLGADADDNAVLGALVDNPALIERPIVIHAGRAAMGRPPEAILALF